MDKLDYYKGRFYAYYQYVVDNYDDSNIEVVVWTKERVDEAYAEKDEKMLRSLDEELTVEINHYPKDYRAVINARIEAAVGIDAEEVEKKRKQKLRTILKRGFIRNDDEYELVHSQIDELISFPDDAPEKKDLPRLDEILVNYSVKPGN